VLSYVLPLRRWDAGDLGELAGYLARLGGDEDVEVIVVDGSDPSVFEHHRHQFGPSVRHLPVDPHFRGRSGKVHGVLTGLAAATAERVVIADDDVRYEPSVLRQVAHRLDRAHVVRPQNHFGPDPASLPWHARWDTARSLLNRAFGADYPGTLAVRRSALTATGGYDANVLFENLELMRTVEAAGGIVHHAPDLYVARLPPSTRQFLGQRVRQAYDSAATPTRLVVELAVIPALTVGLVRRRWAVLLAGAAGVVAAAEVGRHRAGGRRHFPAGASLLAPCWVLERAVCAWCALGLRCLGGGVGYAGTRFRRAASTPRHLRRRLANVTLPTLEEVVTT
jgi:hypothetical protein